MTTARTIPESWIKDSRTITATGRIVSTLGPQGPRAHRARHASRCRRRGRQEGRVAPTTHRKPSRLGRLLLSPKEFTCLQQR